MDPNFATIPQALIALREGSFLILKDDECSLLLFAAPFITLEKFQFFLQATTEDFFVYLPTQSLKESNLIKEESSFSLGKIDRSKNSVRDNFERICSVMQCCDLFSRDLNDFFLKKVLDRFIPDSKLLDLCEKMIISAKICESTESSFFTLAKTAIPMLSVATLLYYQLKVTLVSQAKLPTEYGTFDLKVYRSEEGIEHIALIRGKINAQDNILVRVHSECLTGDIFGSRRCDCGEQLKDTLKHLSEENGGVLVYLRGHEGRGIGLGHKIKAYSLQEKGFDTVDANTELGLPIDSREYGVAAKILEDLGVKKIRLLTNNPAKYAGLKAWGMEIVERVALSTEPNADNEFYLQTKAIKLGHFIAVKEMSNRE